MTSRCARLLPTPYASELTTALALLANHVLAKQEEGSKEHPSQPMNEKSTSNEVLVPWL